MIKHAQHKKRIVISFLGTVLDAGFGKKRHQKWRPNIALHQHGLDIAQVELFVSDKYQRLADVIKDDIHAISPDTQVNCVPMTLTNPWDFSEVYEKLSDWASNYPFDTDTYDYLTHITTGTHVAQICLFLLVERHQIPSLLLQTAPPKRQHDGSQTTLQAIGEVEDALVQLNVLAEEIVVQREALAASQDTLRLTENQYQAGMVDYLAVTSAQTIALNSERTLLNLLGTQLTASVQLISALGGGWQMETGEQ